MTIGIGFSLGVSAPVLAGRGGQAGGSFHIVRGLFGACRRIVGIHRLSIIRAGGISVIHLRRTGNGVAVIADGLSPSTAEIIRELAGLDGIRLDCRDYVLVPDDLGVFTGNGDLMAMVVIRVLGERAYAAPHVSNGLVAYHVAEANVVISPDVKKVGATTFEENLTLNLANIYGVPGSFAETYAANNGLTFYDISSNTPSAITCTPPSQESGDDTTDTTSAPDVDTNDPTVDTGTMTEDNVTDDTSLPDINYDDDTPSDIGNQSEDGNTGLLPVVIVIIAIVVVGVVVAIIVLKRAKGAKRNNDKN